MVDTAPWMPLHTSESHEFTTCSHIQVQLRARLHRDTVRQSPHNLQEDDSRESTRVKLSQQNSHKRVRWLRHAREILASFSLSNGVLSKGFFKPRIHSQPTLHTTRLTKPLSKDKRNPSWSRGLINHYGSIRAFESERGKKPTPGSETTLNRDIALTLALSRAQISATHWQASRHLDAFTRAILHTERDRYTVLLPTPQCTEWLGEKERVRRISEGR